MRAFCEIQSAFWKKTSSGNAERECRLSRGVALMAATPTGSGPVKRLSVSLRGRMRMSVCKEPESNYLTRTGGLRSTLSVEALSS